MSSLLLACYISYALPWYILSVIPCFRPQIRQFIHMQHRNNTCNWTRPWEPLDYRIENENNPSTQIYRIASVHYHFNLLDRLAIAHRVGHLCAKMKTIWQLDDMDVMEKPNCTICGFKFQEDILQQPQVLSIGILIESLVNIFVQTISITCKIHKQKEVLHSKYILFQLKTQLWQSTMVWTNQVHPFLTCTSKILAL